MPLKYQPSAPIAGRRPASVIHARIQAEMTAWARSEDPTTGRARTVEQLAAALGLSYGACWRRLNADVPAWEHLEIVRAAEHQALHEGSDALFRFLADEFMPLPATLFIGARDVERAASASIGASAAGIAADNAALSDGDYSLAECRERIPGLRAKIAGDQRLLAAMEELVARAGEVRRG